MLKHRFLLLLALVVGFLPTTAFAASSSIYGYDDTNQSFGLDGTPRYVNGTDFNTFNRYRDNFRWCEDAGRGTERNCTDNAYMDERQFVILKKEYNLKNGVRTNYNTTTYYQDYNLSDLKEGDVVRAMVYVHNNAQTKTDLQHTAKNVSVSASLSGNTITGSVSADNVYAEFPTFGSSPSRVTFTDAANITLPSGLSIKMLSPTTGEAKAFVKCSTLDAANCRAKDGTAGFLGNNAINGQDGFSVTSNNVTYTKGELVGSNPHMFRLYVDYIVTTGGNESPTASRFVQCTSPNTYDVTFRWNDNVSKLQLSPSPTFNNVLYEKTIASNVKETTGPAGFSPTLPYFTVGMPFYWRVWNGTEWKNGNTINFDCDDYNGPNPPLGPQARRAECIDLNTYKVDFSWTENDYNKIQVATIPDFVSVFQKAVTGKSTRGPEGFSPNFTFNVGTRYFWRVGNTGQWSYGNSFDFNCRDTNSNQNVSPQEPICGNYKLDAGEECDDGGYNGVGDGCTAQCKIISFNECKEGSCACVDMTTLPNYAGDFNKASFKITVENKTTADTLVKRVELVRQFADGKNGEKWIIRDSADQSRLSTEITGRKQGIFLVQNVDVPQSAIIKNASLRAKHDPRNTMPLSIDTTAYLKDQNQPIYINNLFTGEKVDIVLSGTARTSYPAYEFEKDTVSVEYLMGFKTQSNNGYSELLITRPFILTYNDGDLFTSALITGIANLSRVVEETTGNTWQNISGTILNASGLRNRIEGTTINVGVNTQDLQKSIDKSITAFEATTPTSTSDVRISSEADLSKLSQKADGTRIYFAKGNVFLGGDGDTSDYVADKSATIVVDGGTLHINKNIKYKAGNSSVTMAFVTRNGGKIVIHPRVDELNGVYVALDNGEINGDAIWKTYYEKTQPKVLVVKGALYGNTKGLIDSRPNVGDPKKNLLGSAGIAVSFDGRLYSFTPPGLQEIVGTVFEKLK